MKNRQEILSINKGSFGYTGSRKNKVLMENISSSILKGELVCLLGTNGSGKSTLLKTVMRLIPRLNGSIKVNQKDIEKYNKQKLAATLGYVSTEIIRNEEMTVFELVQLGRYPFTNWMGIQDSEDKRMVKESIEKLGLNGMENRKVSEISDGERQRAMIARTVAQNTELILLDEPSAFLDIPNKYEMASLLRSLCEQGKTALFSTHDLNLALAFADKLWLIDGVSLIEGSPEDLILKGEIQKIFKSEKLSFDQLSGNIIPSVSFKKEVTVSSDLNDHVVESWTKKALIRSGFKITNSIDAELSVKISKNNTENIWNLHQDHKNLSFRSIYELLDSLNT